MFPDLLLNPGLDFRGKKNLQHDTKQKMSQKLHLCVCRFLFLFCGESYPPSLTYLQLLPGCTDFRRLPIDRFVDRLCQLLVENVTQLILDLLQDLLLHPLQGYNIHILQIQGVYNIPCWPLVWVDLRMFAPMFHILQLCAVTAPSCTRRACLLIISQEKKKCKE